MKIHHLTAEDAFASLHSGPDGLAVAEAARRLIEFGPNQVESLPLEPLWLKFLKGFIHFFALILWFAAALAFVAEWRAPGQGMAMMGYAILGVILINGLFSFWQEYRAERALSALLKLLPSQVKVTRGGGVEQVEAARLVPGDLVLLQEGDNVPADCRVVEAYGLRVNTATVTGESLPKACDAGPSNVEELLHSKNMLLAGTSVVAGEGKAVVFTTGMNTEFGKIAHLTQAPKERFSPLQREIVHLSHLVAGLSIGLGVVFFFIGQAMGLSFWENFIFAIGIIVANVPEGLLPTVTLSLAMATQRMARRNALVRHLPSVETLGSATVICTDKTGTLTLNQMKVKKLFIDGTYKTPQSLLEHPEPHRELLAAARYCHMLNRKDDGTWLGDPMEVALVQMSEQVNGVWPDLPVLDEVPFDADRKRMSTLYRTASEQVLYTKGALQTVMPLCTHIETESGSVALGTEAREALSRAEQELAEQGLRVLAFASRKVTQGEAHEQLESGLTLSGLVGLEDPPRAEVAEAVRKCHAAGIKVIIVTGDHPHTAVAIAREIGLCTAPLVVTGDDMQHLSSAQLQLKLDAPEIIFARLKADQKMRIVLALQKKGHIVAVTGDGVNDAPALKKADIGIAMGIAGTDVAKEAADMVLLDDNFASIVAAIEEGRAVFDNIRKFLTYILTSNIPEVVPYLAFVLFKIPLPLTVIQILAVDLGTDMLPALGLGTEKPHAGIMQKPPRARGERLLNRALLLRAYLFLGILEAAAALAAFFWVLHGGGWQYGIKLPHHEALYLQATTATLSAIIVMQVVNVFVCRSDRDSIFSGRFFDNRLILAGVAAEITLILLIDYTPWGNALFGTLPIAGEVWLLLIPMALAMLALEELRKWWVRR
ncbi:ATPase [Sulfurimicrobium lacus]|uniref:ATPase n=1 Tax=Sulfurimicrobium lacus TaxID=2715678 RepID=A0A6F8VD93_9PROT|nr:cation-transporting P-type ATPase [Sulfurimicrobium lacus]BCB26986.1 ATPase [Sulfurimicrobium lacus]